MRVAALWALALIVGLPLVATSQANASAREASYYERVDAPQYRQAQRKYHGLKHYRSSTERAEHYRTGSNSWWSSMDRDNRGGRGNY